MDIVERLRMADCKLDGRALEDHADALCHEAASEIERLRGELAARDAEIAAWLRGGGAYLAYGSICEAIATAIASGSYRKDDA